MKIRITVKQGQEIITTFSGRDIDPNNISVGELQDVIKIEQALERLTGFRFHIEQAE